MEMEQTEGQISPEELEQQAPETPDVEPTEGDDDEPIAASAEMEVDENAVATPEYKPNYMFKVHGEEKEMDAWAKELVKTKEDEQKFREIHEKIYGIEHIKADREKYRAQAEEFQPTVERYQALSQSLGALEAFVKSGNYDAFFQKLQIPENEIMNWAAKRLQYQEMSPEQRAEYDHNVAIQQQNVYQGQTLNEVQMQNHQLQHDRRLFELDQMSSKPEVAAAVQAYDQRFGETGKFRQEVINRGIYHYKVNGTDIPVEQAVNEVLAMAGLTPGQQAPAQTAPQAQPQMAPQPTAPAKKPVIPNVEGSGLSATKQPITSIDGLKKLAASRAGVV